MKSVIIAFTGATLVSLIFIYSQSKQIKRLLPGKVDSIVFLDSSHGFIQVVESPRSGTYETLNSGQTWDRTDMVVSGFRKGRSFASNWKGWSIDENMQNHSAIYSTEDGGLTWKVSFMPERKNEFVFGGIQAVSEVEAWAVGINHAYHTTDGGKTWKVGGPSGTGLQFLDGRQGWIEGDRLWRTDNGGVSWQSIPNEGKPCFGGLGFYFLDNQRGWAVSGKTEGNIEGGAETGYVIATSDGGKTCTRIAELPGYFLWSVFFLNNNEGWVGGIGAVLKTEDGGRTWIDSSIGKSEQTVSAPPTE